MALPNGQGDWPYQPPMRGNTIMSFNNMAIGRPLSAPFKIAVIRLWKA